MCMFGHIKPRIDLSSYLIDLVVEYIPMYTKAMVRDSVLCIHKLKVKKSTPKNSAKLGRITLKYKPRDVSPSTTTIVRSKRPSPFSSSSILVNYDEGSISDSCLIKRACVTS